MKHVAFAGTRRGMTAEQRAGVIILLNRLPIYNVVFHHGDCVGSDEEAASIAFALGVHRFVVHPPADPRWRAHWFAAADNVRIELRDPAPYLTRDRQMLDECSRVIATPRQDHPVKSGARGEGTWWVIHHARYLHLPVDIVWPDGTTERSKP